MTPEEFEFEFLLWHEYEKMRADMAKGKQPVVRMSPDFAEKAKKFAEGNYKPPKLPQKPVGKEVNPDEVFGRR